MNDLVLNYIQASQEDEREQKRSGRRKSGTVLMIIVVLIGVIFIGLKSLSSTRVYVDKINKYISHTEAEKMRKFRE